LTPQCRGSLIKQPLEVSKLSLSYAKERHSLETRPEPLSPQKREREIMALLTWGRFHNRYMHQRNSQNYYWLRIVYEANLDVYAYDDAYLSFKIKNNNNYSIGMMKGNPFS
jgi:hypothetical protein